MKPIFAALILAITLTACSDATVIKPATYGEITGWGDDTHAEPFALFVDSCRANAKRSNAYQSRKEGPVGVKAYWQRACSEAEALGQPSDAQARQFFETHFLPYKIETEAQPQGLITGYYEPIINGSRVKKAPYLTPVYGVPSDLSSRKPYHTREEIMRGALKGKAKVLLYVDDPVKLFFLHVQGSGKVRLTDGSTVGLQYAGQNGYTYVPIGRVLKDRGELSTLSLQTIRDWLLSHPDQMDAVMNENPSYVFFKFGPGDRAAKGALGIPLTAGRSLAVDDDRAAYGVPTFLDTTQVKFRSTQSTPLRRLMLSQDTGGALHGPHRGDVFYGEGAAAEWLAGNQNARANVYWLLPVGDTPVVTVPPVEDSGFDLDILPEFSDELLPPEFVTPPEPLAIDPIPVEEAPLPETPAP